MTKVCPEWIMLVAIKFAARREYAKPLSAQQAVSSSPPSSGCGPAPRVGAFGAHHTALWQLTAEEPNPELGGGLLCLLHMPQRIAKEQVGNILQELNRKEMSPRDQPPHFGAWCAGNSENTLAYASFLPNALHRTEGVALSVSIWAFHRAHWADAYLASIGLYS